MSMDDRAEVDSAAEESRREIAKVLHQILQSRPELSLWEKVNLGMAIALLPTRWFKLCLTHLCLALEALSRSDVDHISERDAVWIERFGRMTARDFLGRLESLGYHPDDSFR